MTVGIRVDSSDLIGTGHLHRSLVLADEFRKKNEKVFFISRNFLGNVNFLIKRNFNLQILNFKKDKNFHDLKKSFSRMNIILDAEKTINLLKKFNIKLLILDHYFLNINWQSLVSKHCKIALVDDYLKKKNFVDYYINYHPNIFNKKLEFYLRKPRTKKFIGLKYLLLKSNKYNKKNRKLDIKKNYVFIFMGGVDFKNYTFKILNIIKEMSLDNFYFIVCIGIKNKNKSRIIKKFNSIKSFIFINGNHKDLYKFISDASLIIINAGVSMYESILLKKKLIVISQSQNHNLICYNLNKKYKINYIKYKRNISFNFFSNFLLKVIKKKESIGKVPFDSYGAKRICNHLVRSIS